MNLNPGVIAIAIFGFLAVLAYSGTAVEKERAKQRGEAFVVCVNKGGKFITSNWTSNYECELPKGSSQ